MTASNTYRAVESIKLGDPVLTSTVRVIDGRPKLKWEQRTVTFSDGMDPVPQQSAVLLQYGELGELTVTPEQPMLMPDGTLKTAERLTTDDFLVDKDGNPVTIHAVLLGKQDVGFHSLTTQDFSADIRPEWFLETNGVVAGDHMVLAMQDSDEIAAMFAPGHDDLPKIGTDDYARNASDAFSASASVGAAGRAIATRGFTPIDESIQAVSPVPYGAAPYVTETQAHDIARHGKFRGLTETFLVHDFNYFAKLFKAFYPDIHYYLSWEDYNPNMYAFNAYGNKTVYLSGQLLRFDGLFRQGLAMIMAQGAARFLDTSMADDHGLACTGMADYTGANQVLQTVFYGEYNKWAIPGYQQIADLFSKISAPHHTGYGMCSTPSIPCRLESMDAAISGMLLPPCAGGPVIGALRLEGAVWTKLEDALAICVNFNLRLQPASALKTSNYSLTYKKNGIHQNLRIGLVQMDENSPSVVWLIIDGIKPITEVVLRVRDIVADNGSTLDPSAIETIVE
jgi:hypothetical protein